MHTKIYTYILIVKNLRYYYIVFLVFLKQNYFFFGPLLLFNDVGTTWFVESVVFSWASTFLGLVRMALAGDEPFWNNVFFTDEVRTNLKKSKVYLSLIFR